MKIEKILDDYVKTNNFSLFSTRIKRILRGRLKKRSLNEKITLENFEDIFDDEKQKAFAQHLIDETSLSFELINKAAFELKQWIWLRLTDNKSI